MDTSSGERHAATVQTMRTCWRREADARTSGNPTAADRASADGSVAFWQLMQDLEPALARTAQAYLKDPDLIRDGVHELVVALWTKLRDLSDTASARGWEDGDLFWTCFKRHAINHFTRTVQKNYGKASLPAPDGARRVIEQRQADYALRVDMDDQRDPLTLAADPDAARAFDILLTQSEAQSLLAAIANPKHRDAFLLDWQGLPQLEIAARLGVSLRTAYNWVAHARRDAFTWARQRYQDTGDFAEWLTPEELP